MVSHPPTALATLVLLSWAALPLKPWIHALQWLMLGWTIGLGLKSIDHASQRPHIVRATTEWVHLEPLFVPPSLAKGTDANGEWRGFWHGLDQQGRRIKVWMNAPGHTCPQGRWTLVTLSPIPSTDAASSFDFGAYLQRVGAVGQAEWLHWDNSDCANWSGFHARVWTLSQWWRKRLRTNFGDADSQLILGVFGGERKAVEHEVTDAFGQLGLAHLLSVSGYHVGLVASIFFLFLRCQNRWHKSISVVGVGLSLGFVVACGNPVSGLRSRLMLFLFWCSAIRGRRIKPFECWGIAAVVVALWDVHVPNSLGAQLSFWATGSLLALPNLSSWWRVPLRAQCATAFWTVRTFNVIPWAFYPANLLAGPTMLVLGLLVGISLLLPISCGVGTWAVAFADGLAGGAVWIAEKWPLSASGQPLSGRVGFLILLPFSLHWAVHLVQEKGRRRLLWAILCWSSTLLIGLETAIQVRRDEPVHHALKGREHCWMVTDGHGACGWCNGASQVPQHFARQMGMEGEVLTIVDSDSAKWGQKKRIQPPFEVWIHRRSYRATSHPVRLEDLSSTSTNW